VLLYVNSYYFWWRRGDACIHCLQWCWLYLELHCEVLWRVIEALILMVSSYPSTTKLAAYESIQGCRIAPHTPRYCRRLNVTVSPIKPDYRLQFTLQGDSSESNPFGLFVGCIPLTTDTAYPVTLHIL